MPKFYNSRKKLLGTAYSQDEKDSTVFLVLEYALIGVLILSFNTVWTRILPAYDYVSQVKVIACLVAFIAPIIRYIQKKDIKFEALGFAVVSGLGFCVSVFLTKNPAASLVAYLPIILSIVYADTFQSEKEIIVFLMRFVNVVCVLAVVSLFFFLFGSIFGILKPTETVVYNWGDISTAKSYNSLYFETQFIDSFGYSGIRNDGVFTEAPMFNFVLSLAFLANALIVKKNTWKSIVLVFTILTTFSTTGYLAILIAAGCMLLTANIRNRVLNFLRAAAIPVIAILVIVVFLIVLGDKTDTGSYGVRSDHLDGCTWLFFKTLPLGTGFGNDDLFYKIFTFDQGLSIGTMYLLAQGGIFSIILYIFPSVYAFFQGIRNKDAAYISFQIAFAWLIFVTQAVTLPVFWLFVFLLLWRYPHLTSIRKI